MQVILYATLRDAAGARVIEVPDRQDQTVWELVCALVDRHPPLRPHLLDAHGNLWGHVHVMVNGRDAPYLEHGLNTQLQPGDSLDVFPPVGGG